MDDLNEKVEEVADGVIEAWLYVLAFVISLVIIITSPVWLVPYLIIRKIKRARE